MDGVELIPKEMRGRISKGLDFNVNMKLEKRFTLLRTETKDSASSTLKIDTWEDISRAVAGSGQAGQGWTDEGSIAITARGASKDKQNGMSNGTIRSVYIYLISL